MPAIRVRFAGTRRAGDDDHALARPVVLENDGFDELVLQRWRHIGDRPQNDVATITPRRARRSRVQAKAQARRAIKRNRIGGVEIFAALQPRHAIGAVEVIGDLANSNSSNARPSPGGCGHGCATHTGCPVWKWMRDARVPGTPRSAASQARVPFARLLQSIGNPAGRHRAQTRPGFALNEMRADRGGVPATAADRLLRSPA